MKKLVSILACLMVAISFTACGNKIDESLFKADDPSLLVGYRYTEGDVSFLSRTAVFDLSDRKDVVIRVKADAGISKVDFNGLKIDSKYYGYQNNKLVISKKFFEKENFLIPTDIKLNVTDNNKKKSTIKMIIADKVIRSPQEFQAINDSVDTLKGYYVLGNDIDFAGMNYTMIGCKSNGTTGDPSGNTEDANIYSFKGLLDGAGFTIRNVTINRVFGTTEAEKGYVAGLIRNNKGTIRNLALSNINVTVSGGIAGAVCGMNSGTVTNVYVDGKVTRTDASDGNEPCGGIVGFSDGELSNSVAHVQADGFTICGGNFNTVLNCFAVAKEGSRLDLIGGFRHAGADDENGFEVKNQYVFSLMTGQEAGNANLESLEDLKVAQTFEEFDPLYWYLKDGEYVKLAKLYLPN